METDEIENSSRQLSSTNKKNENSSIKLNASLRLDQKWNACKAESPLPTGAQPLQLNPNQSFSAQPQKILQLHQQQQLFMQQEQQRSTSSQTMMPLHDQSSQTYQGPNAAFGQQPNPDQVKYDSSKDS